MQPHLPGGYDQILWLLGDDKKITEVGAMNIFLIVKCDDGGMLFNATRKSKDH
jgi:hypothetical protein